MYAQKDRQSPSASRQTCDALMRVLHEREPELYQHLHGVGELAVSVGRRLGLGSEDLDLVCRAAEMHDVGKMAVPDAILMKAGPLDEAEWAYMRRHTLIGERILAAVPALMPVARLVRSSHERWDGTGYPDGLRAEQIPLGARIVAVCDAYDAMVSDRPYRDGISPLEALAELRRCAGTQFDPTVVNAFCAEIVPPLPDPAPVGPEAATGDHEAAPA
jgi:HD-GYP domain-containing protein (c-di-GMP phosphodiesterase class II)